MPASDMPFPFDQIDASPHSHHLQAPTNPQNRDLFCLSPRKKIALGGISRRMLADIITARQNQCAGLYGLQPVLKSRLIRIFGKRKGIRNGNRQKPCVQKPLSKPLVERIAEFSATRNAVYALGNANDNFLI